MAVHSQLAPLPSDVPFRLVSKTIGSGAYACIKKAIPADAPQPVFAVKFIHKAYAQKHGRVSMKQLDLEITLHSHLCRDEVPHANIVQFFNAGEDEVWKWIAMELAEGGDLFDKIESDVGIGEDVAHAYFTQLVGAVEFMHGKGVGHRDIKPENVLLSLDGNLKLADFGLATLFAYQGKRKSSKTSCGSPPYTAPEVVRCERKQQQQQGILPPAPAPGYYADAVDIWSSGVVLFVLLVGNTPWDEPSERSHEFYEYVRTDGHPEDDELFDRLPPDAFDMLRGILTVDPARRYTVERIKQHPWFRRKNRFLRADGSIANPVALATTMFESMRVDFSQDPFAPSSQSQAEQRDSNGSLYATRRPDGDDAMDVDSSQMQTRTNTRIPATQVDAEPTPTAELTFDWEKPAVASQAPAQAAQPESASISFTPQDSPPRSSSSIRDVLADEPTLSQFTPAPAVPLSRTQFARRFADILGAERQTVFYSDWSLRPLMELLGRCFRELGIPMAEDPVAGLQGGEEMATLKINAKDGRRQRMRGEVVVETAPHSDGWCQVSFVKMSGDPIEWRRLFKRVVVICQDAVFRPE